MLPESIRLCAQRFRKQRDYATFFNNGGQTAMNFRTLLAWLLFGCLIFESSLAETTEKVYDNGLRLIVREDNRAPVVVSQIWYHVGSSYERDGITGISHALEHMMFKATKKATAGEFSRLVAEHGGSDNAFTGKHYTAYFQRISSDQLELCLRFEADRMTGLVFDEDEFRREIEVIKEERNLRIDSNPVSRFYERFIANVYTRSPLRHPVIGWPEDIDQLEMAQAKEWYRRWYAPNNATLVIAGDVQFSEVDRLVSRYFAEIPPAELKPLKPRYEPPQNGLKLIQGYGQTSTSYLIMAYRSPPITRLEDPADAYALIVLGSILDGGASARFAQYLQREQQVATSVSVGYDAYDRLEGLFTITAVPNNGVSVDDLRRAIDRQIDMLKQEAVSEEELDRVKAQVISSQVYQRDSVFYTAMQVGMLESAGLDRSLLDDYVNQVERVSAEDVQRVARRYLVETGLSVGRFEPQSERPQ